MSRIVYRVPMHEDRPRAPREIPVPRADALIDCYRGLVLGLVAGEGGVPSTVLPQLAFVLAASVRAQLATRSAGSPVAPTQEIRSALLRLRTPAACDWLAEVPALAHPELSPATAAALDGLARGVTLADNDAVDAEALLRVLPLGTWAGHASPQLVTDWAQTTAGFTHGHPEVWSAARFLTVLVGFQLLRAGETGLIGTLDPEPALAFLTSEDPRDPLAERVRRLLDDPARVPLTDPEGRAGTVLCGALAAALTLGEADFATVEAALGQAHQHTRALAHAFIAAQQGAAYLPVGRLAAGELTWVFDALVRDHACTLWAPVSRCPGGRDHLALAALYERPGPEPYTPGS